MIWQQKIQSGRFAVNDFNFTMPNADFLVGSDTTSNIGQPAREYYDYPGDFPSHELGENVSKIRMEEQEAKITEIKGKSVCRAFTCGTTFELDNYYRDDRNQKPYLLTTINHLIGPEDNPEGLAAQPSTDQDNLVYNNTFTCMPAEVQFRPPRSTPRPKVHGVQTAIVVGPEGEEINTDEYGRVQVKFHWARIDKDDQSTSCWIRVGQLMAGSGWGAMFIPRIGHEVIVEFIDGDPDRPIITGQVYNGANPPPYPLPDEKTKSTIKTNSTLGGDGFNEIRFEDKKDDEQIFIHAQRNQDIRVGNDRMESIGNDRHLQVEKDKFEKVDNNRNEEVVADHYEKIGKDRHLDILGKEAKQVGESHSFSVTGDVIEVFKSNHSEQTTGDYFLKADNIVLQAMTNITLQVGSSFIAIEAGGIKISSPAETIVEGTNTTVEGKGMLTLKGGVVKIN